MLLRGAVKASGERKAWNADTPSSIHIGILFGALLMAEQTSAGNEVT